MLAAFEWLTALIRTTEELDNRSSEDQSPPTAVDHSLPLFALALYKRETLRVLQRWGCSDLRTLERRTGIQAKMLVGPALDLGVEGKLTVEWRYVRRRFGRPREYLLFTPLEPVEHWLLADDVPESCEGAVERQANLGRSVSSRHLSGAHE